MASRIPSWGWVSAAPHEHLVVLRNGKVIRDAQGGTAFKWPADAVAILSTSVRRLQFTADQITREMIGVAVTGLAVFRVVEPLIAFRMLDVRDEDAIADILREMFVGATRRLVANLTLEECITRRKDALARELMVEVAPVVQGTGRVEDGSDCGWGLAIDTIEIQDVRVLSEEVFERLQAPYRESLALSALRAESEVAVERHQVKSANERAQETARRELMELEEARLKAERERMSRAAHHTAALEEQKLHAQLARERLRADAEAELANRKFQAELAGTEAAAASAARTAALDAQAERTLGETRADLVRLDRAATAQVSDDRLRELMLTVTLPQVATAFRGSFDKIVVSGGDLGILGQGITQVVATLDALGFPLNRPSTGA